MRHTDAHSTIRSPLLAPVHKEGGANDEKFSRETTQTSSNPLSRTVSLTAFASGAGAGTVKNKPLIFLEIITGRVMVFIMLVTFVTFALCQWFDYESILAGAQTSSFYTYGANACSGDTYTELTGCFSPSPTGSGQLWQGEVVNLDNIVSVSLSMNYNNFTQSSAGSKAAAVTVPYQVDLWACYQSKGCGSSFATSYSDNNAEQWHQVLSIGTPQVPAFTYIMPSLPVTPLSVPVFNLTFQNQESIPTHGIVKAYYCSVHYFLPGNTTAQQAIASAVTDGTGAEGLAFVFQITNRPAIDLQRIFGVLVLFFTVICTPIYYKIVSQEQGSNWLPEQKWCFAYFIILILYQNPVYTVVTFLNTPTSGAVYASYFLDRFSQAAFLVLWLLFGDAPNYHEHVENSDMMKSKAKKAAAEGASVDSGVGANGASLPGVINDREWWWFYAGKVAFGVVIFVASIVVLTYQFPDLTDTGNVRSPVEAVSNWPGGIQEQFIAFTILYLVLFWVWAIWWLYSMYVAVPKQLLKKPYMRTRYLQLSFRFFRWQGSLVFLYYVMQYSAVMVSMWSREASLNIGTLTEEINALFRQQTHLFGKVIFLTVYGVLLSFCFLPASFMINAQTSVLASSYVINERDLERVVVARRKLIERITYMGVMNQLLTQAKPEVLCVELAMEMLKLSWEAYYDPEGVQTLTSAGPMDVSQHDYVLVESAYDPLVETFCYICRHKTSSKIVVAFRGTVNGQHWKSNLDYGKVPLDIFSMTTPELDLADGLEITDDEAEQIESRNTVVSLSTQPTMNTEFKSCVTDHSAEAANRPLTITETFALTAQKGVNALENAYTTTTKLARKAAKGTPGLHYLVESRVHKGFWNAYNGAGIRDFVHRVVRSELKKAPGKVVVTGHSLGGAMSTFCALDLAVHTLPRANEYYKKMRAGLAADKDKTSSEKACCIALYNYGSPKVGNSWFQADFNRWVPDAFRIKVEGDIVTNLPAYGMGFDHVGVEVIIDGNGYGSIIIDQSFVERRLRPRRTGIAVHQLARYKKGLEGILNLGLIILQRESEEDLRRSGVSPAKADGAESPPLVPGERGLSLSSASVSRKAAVSSDASVSRAPVARERLEGEDDSDDDNDDVDAEEEDQPSFFEGLWGSLRSLFLDKRGQQKQMEKQLDLHVEPRQSMSASVRTTNTTNTQHTYHTLDSVNRGEVQV